MASACASERPKFQRATTPSDTGYAVVLQLGPNSFIMRTTLEGKVDTKYAIAYGHRAVGEECAKQNFPYFDVAVITPYELQGYCFKTPDHKALAVEFSARGLTSRPQRFFVDDLHGKTKTRLEKGDELLEIDNVPPLSIAMIKSLVYRAADEGHTSVNLRIHRHDQDLDIREPIALFKNSALGATQLDLLRSRVD